MGGNWNQVPRRKLWSGKLVTLVSEAERGQNVFFSTPESQW
jgi:hypothetical protein